MSKRSVNQLYDQLDAKLDEQAFKKLGNSAPQLPSIIQGLVEAGVKPDDIVWKVLAGHPNMWVEAQQIRAAARHIEREIEAE